MLSLAPLRMKITKHAYKPIISKAVQIRKFLRLLLLFYRQFWVLL